MNLIQVILGVAGYRQARSFERHCRDPRECQEQLLRRTLELNSPTAFGRDHGFGRMRTIADYQQGVPVQSYDSLEPYIEAAMRGETQQLTVDPPFLFATTSGTTGTPKYIPITKTSRRDKSVAMRLWLYHASQAHPQMFDGNILGLVSPEIEGYTPSGLPYGAESGHTYRNMPAVLKTVYAIPYEVFAMKDMAAKYYAVLRIAAANNITMIGTCNPSTILLLATKLNDHAEQIIRDVRDGTLDPGLQYPDEIREHVAEHYPPNPRRAAELERCLEADDQLLPRSIWPELALLGCWKGGSVGLYIEEFNNYFRPETPIRDWGYLASEVRGSVPLTDEGCAGVLTIETNFFEFVHEADIESDKRTYLTVDQLEDGEQYFVFPTTTSGLYRYEMNDLIKVNGFYEATPMVEFIQKGKGVSSLTGEKLYEAQICQAVRECNRLIPVPFEFVVATPEWDHPPGYVFLVEELKEPQPESTWQKWLAAVDERLRGLNEEYDGKRRSLRLRPAELKLLERGEYLRYRQKRVQEGVPDGQFKMLKLNPDLEFQNQFKIAKVIKPS